MAASRRAARSAPRCFGAQRRLRCHAALPSAFDARCAAAAALISIRRHNIAPAVPRQRQPRDTRHNVADMTPPRRLPRCSSAQFRHYASAMLVLFDAFFDYSVAFAKVLLRHVMSFALLAESR